MAFRLLVYLDLKRGANGYPVGGYRYVSKALGWQPRTVSKYAKALEREGLIRLTTRGAGVHQSVRMEVLRNPSRGRDAGVRLSHHPERAAHRKKPYGSSNGSSNSSKEARAVQPHRTNPDAPHAPLPRSVRSGLLEVLAPLLDDDPRCSNCLGLLKPPTDRKADDQELCTCPFVNEASQ